MKVDDEFNKNWLLVLKDYFKRVDFIWLIWFGIWIGIHLGRFEVSSTVFNEYQMIGLPAESLLTVAMAIVDLRLLMIIPVAHI